MWFGVIVNILVIFAQFKIVLYKSDFFNFVFRNFIDSRKKTTLKEISLNSTL